MKVETYMKKMGQHKVRFNKLWGKMVYDTNDFIATNNEKDFNFQTFWGTEVDQITDDMILSGAWLQDRLNHITATTHSKSYKKSLTKKVRKALGFNL